MPKITTSEAKQKFIGGCLGML